MDRNHRPVEPIIRSQPGLSLDARYLAFFARFNQQQFFEAHEALEELWLGQRGGPRDLFYKGLIQLAGAFVHLQKRRPAPAASLFRLAQANLAKYPGLYEGLELQTARKLIVQWLARIERAEGELSLAANPPELGLAKPGSGV